MKTRHKHGNASRFIAAAGLLAAAASWSAVLAGPGAPKDPSRRLSIVGQDLGAVHGYVESGKFPTPGGVTGYVSLWDIANGSAYYPYGGLGQDNAGGAYKDVDWGAGPTNARNTGLGYPNSALVLGVYMTEEFCAGCLSKLAQGQYDTEIRKLALFVKSMDKPVFLRIGYEFDGPWNVGYEKTDSYKAAWRRIADTVHALAPNAITVLQGASSPVGVDKDVAAWYPGDQYVDWVGFSWFLSGHPRQKVLADKILAMARKHGKPVLVAESSPQGYDLSDGTLKAINAIAGEMDPRLSAAPATLLADKTPDQIWTEWYKPILDYIEANKDAIRAWAYIDCDWNLQAKWGAPYKEGYWGDSRLQASGAMTEKWNAELAKPAWMHGSPKLFDSLLARGQAGDTGTAVPPVVAPPTGRIASRSMLGMPGKTALIIGQVYKNEYDSYRRAMGLPAGSSHYGEMYNGDINQGDDGANLAHVEFVDGLQDSAIMQVAISWKDNPALSKHPVDECGDFIGKRVYQVSQDIARGDYDDQIDKFAAVFASKPHVTFLLRVEYEVSQFAFSWKPSAACPQPGTSYDFSDASIIDNAPYKAAFRHVVERIRDTKGLANVKYVFHPVRGIGDAKAMYPGSDVVDFVGLSLFNDDVCYGDHNCKGLIDGNARQVFTWARDDLKKPRMISEAAWQPLATTDAAWKTWAASPAGVIDYLARLRSIVDTFDVAAVSYINSDWNAHGWDPAWWGDSRVEIRDDIAAWWKDNILDSPRYLLGRARGAAGLEPRRGMPESVISDARGWMVGGLANTAWTLRNLDGSLVARGKGERVDANGSARGIYLLESPLGNRLLRKVR